MANEYTFDTGELAYELEGSSIDYDSIMWMGYDQSIYDTPANGACRFLNITQNGTMNYAALMMYAGSVYPDHDQSVKIRCRGLDYDDFDEFGGGNNPFSGKNYTSADKTQTWGDTHAGSWVELNVTSIVNEIMARGGWASGNNMAFILEDNGTATDQDRSVLSGLAYLVIRPTAAPDFTPTPLSISAPTFPDTENWGIKISEPGVNVLDASEDQLFFTTRKKGLKIILEGNVDCTAGVKKTIAHGLGYTPTVMGFAKGSTFRFWLSRFLAGAADPSGAGTQGWIGSDDTNINITVNQNANVYYYAFIDELV